MPGLSSQGLLDEGNAIRHGNSPLSLCAAPSQALGLIGDQLYVASKSGTVCVLEHIPDGLILSKSQKKRLRSPLSHRFHYPWQGRSSFPLDQII